MLVDLKKENQIIKYSSTRKKVKNKILREIELLASGSEIHIDILYLVFRLKESDRE